MNIDVFAEWLRRQGLTIVQSPSSYWYGRALRPYNAFPSHTLIEPTEDELRDLQVHEGAALLRYSAPFTSSAGKLSYHIVYEGAYDFARLSSKMRQRMRRGVKACQVERIALERLAHEGWVLQQDSLERQGHPGSMTQEAWVRIVRAAADLPGFEAWGAMIDGELAGTIFALRIGDTCYRLYRNSHRKFLRQLVNNIMCYVFSEEVLARPEIARIFHGVHSLDAPTSQDEFKLRMGYQLKPVRQRIEVHPWLAPGFNLATHAAIKALHRRYPQNTLFSKTEGLLRFYLDGQRPLDQQSWPELLLPQREALQGRSSQQSPIVTAELV